MTFLLIATSFMQMESSFQHFCVQYVFGFWNENVLRVKWGYFKKVMTHKLRQNANFENGGVSLFKLASCMYC